MALTQSQKATQACAYAALLLKDSQKDLTAENINAVAAAAGVKVDASFAQVFARVLTQDSLNTLVQKLSKVGGAAPAVASSGAAPAAAPAAAEKKPETESEEEDDDAFGGLF